MLLQPCIQGKAAQVVCHRDSWTTVSQQGACKECKVPLYAEWKEEKIGNNQSQTLQVIPLSDSL